MSLTTIEFLNSTKHPLLNQNRIPNILIKLEINQQMVTFLNSIDLKKTQVIDHNLSTPWKQKNFNDSSWGQAIKSTPPKGKLVSQMLPPIRVTKVVKPIHFYQAQPGVWIYDMAQNAAAMIKLTMSGISCKIN